MQADPTSLELKVAAYEQCQLNIERLQEELRQEQETLATLKQEISTQNPALLAAIHKNPIRRAPNEILSMIFACYVQDQPTHIRRLLLVCRRWYNIVMNSPSLWNRIQIIAHTSFNQDHFLSRGVYVHTCIERSQDMLLDIVVDYGKCKSVPRHYFDHMLQDLQNILEDVPDEALENAEKQERYSWVDYGNDSERYSSFMGWLETIDWYSCPVNPQLIDYYLIPLQHLVGNGGQYMERWRSLNLVFPLGRDDEMRSLAGDAMKLFCYPTPFLESISLTGLNWSTSSPLSSTDRRPFPSVPRLITLHLPDERVQAIIPLIDYSQLVDLYMYVGSFEQLCVLSTCRRLRRLGLYLSNVKDDIVVPISVTFELPHLQELVCKGYVPESMRAVLHAPNLRVLHLGDYTSFQTVGVCSFVPSTTRLVIYHDELGLRGYNARSATDHIKILVKFTSLTEICVHPIYQTSIEECVDQMRGLGWLPSLQRLVVGNDFDDVENKTHLR